MRIGLFSDYYFSRGDGTAEATRLSAQVLRARGHFVQVFCPLLGGAGSEKVMGFRSIPGWLYPGLRISWPFRRRNLERVSRLKLDVVHIHTPIFIGLFGLWVARRQKIPSVATVHLDMDFMASYGVRLPMLAGMMLMSAVITRDPTVIKQFWPRRVDKSKRRREDFAWRSMAYFASHCDAVIAPSEKNYEQLCKYLPKGKVRLVPNGINTIDTPAKTLARKRLGLAREFIVISTARHVREKRLGVILKAFAGLDGGRLIILNDGPKRRSLERLTAKLGIKERVSFAGTVSREQVALYLAASDVFVNACLREVASLGILEAAAAGKPLLLFDRRLSEPLADGVNGYFVKSPEGLTRRLQQLRRDPARLKLLGRNSISRVRPYNLEHYCRALEAVYKSL